MLVAPCLTLRGNTKRPETITTGTNELIGTDPSKLPLALACLMVRSRNKARFLPNGTARRQSNSWNTWSKCWEVDERGSFYVYAREKTLDRFSVS